jgi:hypothetical protein
MKIVAVAGTAVVSVFLALITLTVLTISAATGAGAPSAPSASALADIPPGLLEVYRAAADSCPLPWPVLAAIGKVESDYGRSTLPGVAAGTANSAGAMGPMQFLAATWAAYGVDGNGDGRADVYDPTDAIWGAARYLCANGAGNPDTLRGAIWTYNHSDTYVADVLRVAGSYAQAETAEHALPVDQSIFDQHPDYLTAPHHDYPAIDISVPIGTTVYAVSTGTAAFVAADSGMCGGTIIINGDDGARYTYCHLSQELVSTGDHVTTGSTIALSGGEPGAPGAGDSTGPHLHLGIALNGINICPQPLLVAWSQGQPADPGSAPSSGCTY